MASRQSDTGPAEAAIRPPTRRGGLAWRVAALMFGALAVLGILYEQDVRDLGHWPLKRARASLAPWTWPSVPFDEAAWRRSLPENRFRLLNGLLHSRQLSRLDADGVALLLGGPVQETMRFKLKDAGDGLWYVLVVECPGGRACTPHMGMAYFDRQ